MCAFSTKNKYQLIVTLGVLLLFFSIPLHQTHAQFGTILSTLSSAAGGKNVNIVSNTSATDVKAAIAAAKTSLNSAGTLLLGTALERKENILDPIIWNLGKSAIQQTTADMVKWMNSGFDGNPAFVTNLGEFMGDVAEQAGANYVYGDELNGLCVKDQTAVRTALAQSERTQSSGNSGGAGGSGGPICTADTVSNGNAEAFSQGDFSQGAYPALFDLIFSSGNDINKAYLNAEVEKSTRKLEAQIQEQTIAGWGDGVLSTKTCTNTSNGTGGSSKNCKITTPGSILQDMFAFQVGELPALQLLAADEVNEVIASTMSGLSKQILQGTNGLLGLGGNNSYTDNSYGTGSQSYLDALRDDNISGYQNVQSNPVGDAVEAEVRFIELLTEILSTVTEIENRLGTEKEKYPNCFSLTLDTSLVNIRDDHTNFLNISKKVLEALMILETQLETATDAASQQEVYNQFYKLDKAGYVHTTYSNQIFEIEFVDLDFALIVEAFQKQIASAVSKCN